ncbi:MAG TPA: SRPBCC domain-containing protein [Solirubrobacterales bacterium]|nr:SRPBCC domain-containing protein [Solirubrobacterales bacterium]
MPETPSETSPLEYELRVAARPETVFAFFTDPRKMTQWMGAQATLDPRPGGICRIVFRPPEEKIGEFGALLGVAEELDRGSVENVSVMMGEFVEVDPHRRIVLTWGLEQEILAVPPQSTAVEISFVRDGEETIVRLTHRRLPPAAVAFHRAGWEHFLPRLAIAAEGGDPGPDSWQAHQAS